MKAQHPARKVAPSFFVIEPPAFSGIRLNQSGFFNFLSLAGPEYFPCSGHYGSAWVSAPRQPALKCSLRLSGITRLAFPCHIAYRSRHPCKYAIYGVPTMEAQVPVTPNCQRCGADISRKPSFSFKSPAASFDADQGLAAGTVKCLNCSLIHWPMLKRSAAASIVVGTILTALNQGDLLLSGQWTSAFFWKIPLTYCVPFVVATYGALTNNRR